MSYAHTKRRKLIGTAKRQRKPGTWHKWFETAVAEICHERFTRDNPTVFTVQDLADAGLLPVRSHNV